MNQSGKIKLWIVFIGLMITFLLSVFISSKLSAQVDPSQPSTKALQLTQVALQQTQIAIAGGGGGGVVNTPTNTPTPVYMTSLVLPNSIPVALPTVTGKGYYLEEVDIPSTSGGNTIVLTGGTSPLTVILPSNQSFNTNDNAYPFLPVYFTAASSAITWTQTGTSSINIPYKAYTK